MGKIIIAAALVLWAAQAPAATYYIDPSCSINGNGSTTVCGASGPFNSWAKVPWGAGNTYSQKGGTTAHEQITVGASGSPGKVITLNSYGTGNANLNGGVVIPPGSWTPGDPAPGVYSTAGFGYDLLEDGIFLKWASSPGCSDGNYYYVWGSSSPDYYRPTTGVPSDHVVEKVTSAGVQLGANSYITVSGFNFTKYRYGVTGNAAGSGTTNSHITITGNSFANLEFGVWINFNATVSQNITVSNNSFDYLFSSIELQNQGNCSGSGEHNLAEISNNTITHCSEISGVNGAYDWSQVDTAGWDKEGIGFQDLTNSNVHDNKITGSCKGIVLFTCANDESYNNDFYRNYISTSLTPLVFQPRYTSPSAKSFYNNKVFLNLLIGGKNGQSESGMYLTNIPSPVAPSDDMKCNCIYNNTIIPATNGIYSDTTSDYYNIMNNIVYGGVNYQIAQIGAAAPAHIVYDHNLYFGSSQTLFYINGSSLNWSQWKALGANYDAHSPAPAAPRLNSVAGWEYTPAPGSPALDNGIKIDFSAPCSCTPATGPQAVSDLGAYPRTINLSIP